ncbi:MAG: efflux RND transporter periplasmic adaptor subunit [Planctomycetota bacterium]|jgi:multidrug efflux pump subunit AcrA (membrane-fusion protein)
MRSGVLVLMVCLVAGLAGIQAQEMKEAKKDSDCIVVERRDFETAESLDGVFTPASYEEIELWPEEYSGELLVLEVIEHGTLVSKGDLIARLELKSIDRQIELLEREIRSSALSLKSTKERAALDEARARAKLDDTRAELELARRDLEGWEKHELEFKKREADMYKQATQNYIDDQKDELAQLESMYRDDELVDATEEIVMKRARRDLARSMKALDLQVERRDYTESFSEPAQTERRRMQFRTKELGLQQLIRTQEIDKRSREDGILKAELAFKDQEDKLARIKRDREMLTLRAPADGVLLHGSAEKYRPGSASPRYERGSRLGFRTTLFVVADPDRFNLALNVPESKLEVLKPGMGAKVTPTVPTKIEAAGTLRMDRFPSPKSAAGPENKYEAVIEVDGSMIGLVAGMRGKAEFNVEELTDVVVLPKNTVFGAGKEAHCWIADETSGEYRRVDLELGPEREGEVVVHGEIEAGQKVLLRAPKK